MLLCAFAVLAGSLGFASRAWASTGTAVIADCNSHNTLTRTYSNAQLENAMRTMPADVAEYTNCRDVIQRALLAQEGKLHRTGGTAQGGAGGAFLPTPLIVVLVALLLGAAVLAAAGMRRRRSSLAD